MLQNLQNIAKFQNFQLDNLVDFEKCWKTRIFLQRSVPIQPKTSEILPKIGNNQTGAAELGGLPRGTARRGFGRRAPTGPTPTSGAASSATEALSERKIHEVGQGYFSSVSCPFTSSLSSATGISYELSTFSNRFGERPRACCQNRTKIELFGGHWRKGENFKTNN